jgi:hypothetical protein
LVAERPRKEGVGSAGTAGGCSVRVLRVARRAPRIAGPPIQLRTSPSAYWRAVGSDATRKIVACGPTRSCSSASDGATSIRRWSTTATHSPGNSTRRVPSCSSARITSSMSTAIEDRACPNRSSVGEADLCEAWPRRLALAPLWRAQRAPNARSAAGRSNGGQRSVGLVSVAGQVRVRRRSGTEDKS